MAKPYLQISKSDLYKDYNLVDVYDGVTLMKSLSQIKPNHFYAEYTHKHDVSQPPKWFTAYMEAFEKRFEDKIMRMVDQKLDQRFKEFAELNNLKYKK